MTVFIRMYIRLSCTVTKQSIIVASRPFYITILDIIEHTYFGVIRFPKSQFFVVQVYRLMRGVSADQRYFEMRLRTAVETSATHFSIKHKYNVPQDVVVRQRNRKKNTAGEPIIETASIILLTFTQHQPPSRRPGYSKTRPWRHVDTGDRKPRVGRR